MNKYVVIKKIDGEIVDPVIMTATEIFNLMDMSDCYDISIRLWFVEAGSLFPAKFCGTHCCAGDNLRMEIRDEITNEILDVGYGTDH